VGKGYEPAVVIVDTGILYAFADRADSWHKRSVRFLEGYRGKLIVPCPVIPEACYLMNRYLGGQAEQAFLRSLVNREMGVEHLDQQDLLCCTKLIEKYADLNLGFVDASLIAICERRGISGILTTDRRHFSAVRSARNEPFVLLP